MTQLIQTLEEALDGIEAIVCDQWGVLHNGLRAYPHAREALKRAKAQGKSLSVISNSGKRTTPNIERIAAMGFELELFDQVLTSGESLWRYFAKKSKRMPKPTQIFGITRNPQELLDWSAGLDIALTSLEDAEAIVLLSLDENLEQDHFQPQLEQAVARNLPLYCGNPDLVALRADNSAGPAPGSLAWDYRNMGGRVEYYGKPHLPLFRDMESLLQVVPQQILMVGDSLSHDIKGGHAAGWKTLLVRDGIYRTDFWGMSEPKIMPQIEFMLEVYKTPAPDYSIHQLQ